MLLWPMTLSQDSVDYKEDIYIIREDGQIDGDPPYDPSWKEIQNILHRIAEQRNFHQSRLKRLELIEAAVRRKMQ